MSLGLGFFIGSIVLAGLVYIYIDHIIYPRWRESMLAGLVKLGGTAQSAEELRAKVTGKKNTPLLGSPIYHFLSKEVAKGTVERFGRTSSENRYRITKKGLQVLDELSGY